MSPDAPDSSKIPEAAASGPSSPFPAPTMKEWRALAEKALRGLPLAELASPTLEGIDLELVPTQEVESRVAHLGGLPGIAPFVRGAAAKNQGDRSWLKRTDLALPLPESWGEAARDHLASGATALGMMLDRASRCGLDPDMDQARGLIGRQGLSLSSLEDLALALEGVDLTNTPLFIECGGAGLQLAGMLFALARRRGVPLKQLSGSLSCDPLGELAAGGALPVPLSQAYDEMASLISWAERHTLSMRITMVHLSPYHDAGGSAVHELAFALATGAEYLAAMTDRGLTPDEAAGRISFSFDLGPRLLTELSKLRAARILWSQVCRAFGCADGSGAMRIHARTSRYAMTARAPWTNVLRGSLSAFAGVLAQADCISVAPFDEPLGPSDSFSRRLARNTQLVLELEAHLGQVCDPAGGSWAVEQLTDGLARRAWTLFQQVEALGGMSAALAAGMPQRELRALAAGRREAIARGAQTLVGVNRFALPDEELPTRPKGEMSDVRTERAEALDQLRQSRASVAGALEESLEQVSKLKDGSGSEVVAAAIAAARSSATLGEMTAALRQSPEIGPRVEPLDRARAGEDFNLLREASDNYLGRTGERPRLLLCGLGPLPGRRVRQELAADIARAGGLHVAELELAGDILPEQAAQAVLDDGARAVVLCGNDEAYSRLAAPLAQALKAADPRLTVGLSGEHGGENSLAPAGVDLFFHPRLDRVKTIKELQRAMGVML